MARIRSVHPGQWTDVDFVSCSPLARLLAISLRNYSDDNGVFQWKPAELKMKCLPADNCDAEALLLEIEANGLVTRFEVNGKLYGITRKFQAWQRPQRPTFEHPVPPDEVLELPGYDLNPSYRRAHGRLTEGSRDSSAKEGKEGGMGSDGPSSSSKRRRPNDWPLLRSLIDEYNGVAKKTGLPSVDKITDKRKVHIRSRLREHGEEKVRRVLRAPLESEFLRGETGRGSWTGATFDWLMVPSNFQKTLEGNYQDRTNPPSGPDRDQHGHSRAERGLE